MRFPEALKRSAGRVAQAARDAEDWATRPNPSKRSIVLLCIGVILMMVLIRIGSKL